MSVRRKQVVIIVLSVLWGYLSAAFFFFGPAINWLYNDFTGCIYMLFLASTPFCNIIFSLIGVNYPYWFGAGIYFLMQTIIYLVTGSLIAGIYGKIKLSRMPEEQVEPVLEDDEESE